jgi:hypothetical protein
VVSSAVLPRRHPVLQRRTNTHFFSSFFFVLRSFYTLRFVDAGTAQETTPLGSIPLVGALLRVNRVDVKKGLRSDLAWSVASPGTHARVRCLCVRCF